MAIKWGMIQDGWGTAMRCWFCRERLAVHMTYAAVTDPTGAHRYRELCRPCGKEYERRMNAPLD